MWSFEEKVIEKLEDTNTVTELKKLESNELTLRSKSIKINEEILINYTVLKDLIEYKININF